jgi:hypothetical protein
MGNSEPTIYRWKKLYAGMGINEARRFKNEPYISIRFFYLVERDIAK